MTQVNGSKKTHVMYAYSALCSNRKNIDCKALEDGDELIWYHIEQL